MKKKSLKIFINIIVLSIIMFHGVSSAQTFREVIAIAIVQEGTLEFDPGITIGKALGIYKYFVDTD